MDRSPVPGLGIAQELTENLRIDRDVRKHFLPGHQAAKVLLAPLSGWQISVFDHLPKGIQGQWPTKQAANTG